MSDEIKRIYRIMLILEDVRPISCEREKDGSVTITYTTKHLLYTDFTMRLRPVEK